MEPTQSPIHDLVLEIIELILSKCPVKSVIRFKSVSKSWLSIISNPRFLRMLESKLSSESKKKFFLWAELYHNKFPYPFYMTLEDGKFRKDSVLGYPISQDFDFSPLCSCDGLILLGAKFHKRYILWNPLIRKHIIIPVPVPALDTYASPHHHHMYHDSITDDYKIAIFYEKWFAVYSCKSGSWGEIKDRDWEGHRKINAVVDGRVYSMQHSGEIICFDARDGKVHKFTQPEGVETLVEVELEEVSGRLCLYGFSQDYDDVDKLQLWVMEKEKIGKCWRKIIISLEKVDVDKSSLVPHCLTDEDDVILWTPDLSLYKKYFMYSPGSPSLQEIKLGFIWRDLKLPDYICSCCSTGNCEPWNLEIMADYTTHFFRYSETLYMPSS